MNEFRILQIGLNLRSLPQIFVSDYKFVKNSTSSIPSFHSIFARRFQNKLNLFLHFLFYFSINFFCIHHSMTKLLLYSMTLCMRVSYGVVNSCFIALKTLLSVSCVGTLFGVSYFNTTSLTSSFSLISVPVVRTRHV